MGYVLLKSHCYYLGRFYLRNKLRTLRMNWEKGPKMYMLHVCIEADTVNQSSMTKNGWWTDSAPAHASVPNLIWICPQLDFLLTLSQLLPLWLQGSPFVSGPRLLFVGFRKIKKWLITCGAWIIVSPFPIKIAPAHSLSVASTAVGDVPLWREIENTNYCSPDELFMCFVIKEQH